jgi:ATP-dependent Zn protease
MQLSRGLLGWLIFVGVAAVLFAFLRQAHSNDTPITLSDFYAELKAGNVAKVGIDDDSINGSFRTAVNTGGRPVLSFRANLPPGASGVITRMVLEASPPVVVQSAPTNAVLTNVILPFIPWLLILLFIWFFVFRNLRRNAAQGVPTPVVIVNPEGQ